MKNISLRRWIALLAVTLLVQGCRYPVTEEGSLQRMQDLSEEGQRINCDSDGALENYIRAVAAHRSGNYELAHEYMDAAEAIAKRECASE